MKTIENLVRRYEKSALLRSLVQLIPFGIGSSFDTAVAVKFQAIKEERIRIFFDYLAKKDNHLTPELIDNNDFLHCFYITADAVIRTSRASKIHAFACLLGNTTRLEKFSGIDEYEEFLGILNELSSRELSVLTMLDSFELEYPILKDENELQRAMRFWDKFLSALTSELGIAAEEINSILTRLNRSGCYETYIGAYWGYMGNKGKTTPFFKRLKAIALTSYSD